MIVCIEGITNSGKSSLCNLICEKKNIQLVNNKLKNRIAIRQIKKITGPAENLDKFDYKTELFLYSAILAEKSNVAISLNGDLLLDRFALSIYSYFSARYDIDEEFLRGVVSYASRNIIPDVTIFLDVSLDTIISRATSSPFTRKDIGIEEYFEKLKQNYIEHLNEFTKKGFVLKCDEMETKDIYDCICEFIRW